MNRQLAATVAWVASVTLAPRVVDGQGELKTWRAMQVNAQARWTVGRAIVTIGSETGGQETLFSRVQYVQRLPGNTLLVVDGATNELRYFGSEGRFIRRAGGKGSGPAEFRSIAGVVIERDSLRVFDSTLRKLVTFSLAGDFARTLRVESTTSAVHPLQLYQLAGFINGDPILVAGGFPADMRPTPVKYWDSLPTLRYRATGALRDTIGEFAGMDTYSTPRESGDIKFGRASSAVVAGNKLYMTDGGRMALRVYAGSRSPLAIAQRQLAPRPVSSKDAEDLSNHMLSRARDADSKLRIERHLAEWPRSAFKPWISSLRVDAMGFVWAEQYAPYWDPAPRVWHVFDAQARWVAEVTMPPGFRVHQIGTDFVAGVALDSDGVESVAVLALRR